MEGNGIHNMLIVQPLTDFGDRICEELASYNDGRRQWDIFEFAVAWVNYPGVSRIFDSLKTFLADGGYIRATVGLDFASTSYEGLSKLLDLECEGQNIKTHVFFDENRACTFHPKIFLFKNFIHARLFVGSNNMTGAGLGSNIEVALEYTAALDDETIEKTDETLTRWRDEQSESRTRQLTRELLEQLYDQGYVRTEQEIRNARESEANSAHSKREPLFGKSKIDSGNRISRAKKTGLGEQGVTSDSGTVMLMRVRPRRNGKQLQISMKVYEGLFMQSAAVVVSAASNECREIGFNFTKRNGKKVRNTARFEAPELEGIANPVARFIWLEAPNSVLQYEILDADDNADGTKTYKKLQDGISTPPLIRLEELGTAETVLSKTDKEKAQWYRLD